MTTTRIIPRFVLSPPSKFLSLRPCLTHHLAQYLEHRKGPINTGWVNRWINESSFLIPALKLGLLLKMWSTLGKIHQNRWFSLKNLQDFFFKQLRNKKKLRKKNHWEGKRPWENFWIKHVKWKNGSTQDDHWHCLCKNYAHPVPKEQGIMQCLWHRKTLQSKTKQAIWGRWTGVSSDLKGAEQGNPAVIGTARELPLSDFTNWFWVHHDVPLLPCMNTPCLPEKCECCPERRPGPSLSSSTPHPWAQLTVPHLPYSSLLTAGPGYSGCCPTGLWCFHPPRCLISQSCTFILLFPLILQCPLVCLYARPHHWPPSDPPGHSSAITPHLVSTRK